MTRAKGKILNWGNSLGIRLNKVDILNSDLQPNDEVEVNIKKRFTVGRDIFAKMKKTIDTEKSLKEIDEMFGEW